MILRAATTNHIFCWCSWGTFTKTSNATPIWWIGREFSTRQGSDTRLRLSHGLLRYNPNVEVERFQNGLYRGDRDEAASLVDAVMGKIRLQVSRIPWFNVPERALHIFDLVHSDLYLYALVRSCIKTVRVYFCTLFVVIVLDHLVFVVVLHSWMQKIPWGTLRAWRSSLLDIPNLHKSEAHIPRRGWHLIHPLKHVLRRMGFHLLQYHSCKNGNDLNWYCRQGSGCSSSPAESRFHRLSPGQVGSTRSGWLLVHPDNQPDGNNRFEATLVNWPPIVIINARLLKSTKGTHRRWKLFWKQILAGKRRK